MRPKLPSRSRRAAIAVGLAAAAVTGALAHTPPATAAPAGLNAIYAKRNGFSASLKSTYFDLEVPLGDLRFTGTTTTTLWGGSWGRATIIHSPATGAHEIHGNIFNYYWDH
jgi:hypothetical protein